MKISAGLLLDLIICFKIHSTFPHHSCFPLICPRLVLWAELTLSSASFFKILEVRWRSEHKEIEKLFSGDKQISFYSVEETSIEECDMWPFLPDRGKFLRLMISSQVPCQLSLLAACKTPSDLIQSSCDLHIVKIFAR